MYYCLASWNLIASFSVSVTSPSMRLWIRIHRFTLVQFRILLLTLMRSFDPPSSYCECSHISYVNKLTVIVSFFLCIFFYIFWSWKPLIRPGFTWNAASGSGLNESCSATLLFTINAIGQSATAYPLHSPYTPLPPRPYVLFYCRCGKRTWPQLSKAVFLRSIVLVFTFKSFEFQVTWWSTASP